MPLNTTLNNGTWYGLMHRANAFCSEGQSSNPPKVFKEQNKRKISWDWFTSIDKERPSNGLYKVDKNMYRYRLS